MATNDKSAVEAVVALFQREDGVAARGAAQALLVNDPADANALYLVGSIAMKEGRPDVARHCFEHTLAIRWDFPSAHFHLGVLSLGGGAKSTAKAREHFRTAARLKPGWFEALYFLGRCCAGTGLLDEAARCFRAAVALQPDHADTNHRLSEVSLQADLMDEARRSLQRAVVIDPTVTQTARADLAALNAGAAVARPVVRNARYPSAAAIHDNFRETVLRQVVGRVPEHRTFGRSSRIFTMGSCFARNIVRSLTKAGYQADLLDVAEHVNSTYANRCLVDWLRGELRGEVQERIDWLTAGTVEREPLLEKIRNADVFIFTLGVAPCFFDRRTGEFIMPRPSSINLRALAERFDFRTTTVEENVGNILYVIDFIRSINPGVKVVLTLSPVPLHATFEYDSAVVADCVSKSVLRVAADTLMRMGIERMHYWPSFEIVRWLGAHTGPVYGVDDGVAWHISEDLVDTIVGLFIDVHGPGADAPA